MQNYVPFLSFHLIPLAPWSVGDYKLAEDGAGALSAPGEEKRKYNVHSDDCNMLVVLILLFGRNRKMENQNGILHGVKEDPVGILSALPWLLISWEKHWISTREERFP